MSDFKIQPIPTDPPQEGGGMNHGLQSGAAGAFHATGPQIPSQDALAQAEVLSKEELKKRQEELNK